MLVQVYLREREREVCFEMRDGGGGHWGVMRVVFDVTALMGLEWVLDILRHLLFIIDETIGSLPTYLSHSSMHPCGGLLLDYY